MCIIHSLETVLCYPALYLPFHLSVMVKVIEWKLLQKSLAGNEIKAKSPNRNSNFICFFAAQLHFSNFV